MFLNPARWAYLNRHEKKKGLFIEFSSEEKKFEKIVSHIFKKDVNISWAIFIKWKILKLKKKDFLLPWMIDWISQLRNRYTNVFI